MRDTMEEVPLETEDRAWLMFAKVFCSERLRTLQLVSAQNEFAIMRLRSTNENPK